MAPVERRLHALERDRIGAGATLPREREHPLEVIAQHLMLARRRRERAQAIELAAGLGCDRLGERRLDNSARVGPWILLSTQGWDELAVVDLRAEDRVERIPMPASIVQIVASSSGTAVAVLTRAGLMLWKHPAA